ncbi:MAG TPA: TrkA family potassium uptake protein [Bacteroidales bacterium]|nr:TrkA family potassium uptake protein [Bacteroidales bacterium]HQN15692.1 TrkA family potassium uptake protein [Bacteroidales bacterium]HQP15151.1 TrkA family potassium uptake protein [Bacteroidales bacterium]
MKIVVIGLGNFGSTLAMRLTQMGHEVIGVDKDMVKVQLLKDDVTHAMCLDSTDIHSVKVLPLRDADVVVVSIGEDTGASIMTTALMKQLNVKRIISRAISKLHVAVLEAMGIKEILHPEHETAIRLAKKLNLPGFVDSFEVSSDHNVIEIIAPQSFVGKTLLDLNLTRKYNILVLTTIKVKSGINILGIESKKRIVNDVATSDTKIYDGDILLIYGAVIDIKRMLKDEE